MMAESDEDTQDGSKNDSNPSDSTTVMSDNEQRAAAGVIQKNYRGHRTRRQMRGLGLDPSTRWMEAVKDAQYRELTKPRPRSESCTSSDPASRVQSEARQNWRRVGNIARRAGGDDGPSDASSDDSTDEDSPSHKLTEEERAAAREKKIESRKQRERGAKMMDLQYFLEMVDVKHRYGSNLRTYHNCWKTADTNENFFYWLDFGEGKKVELPICSRERLDKERVRYLSREERLKYLVKVDKDGRLRWAKNGERIWTDSKRFRDSVDGIVPIDDATPTFNAASLEESSEESSEEEAERYLNHDLDNAKGLKKIGHVSPATIFNHLMRHSIKGGRSGWIFVADTSFHLYVGMKQSGSFQHSSFLHGGRISSAGIIKIRDGQLRSLSPLSGHYRPPAANFRIFIHNLKDAGVDMSRVSISKSYAVLVGLEGYMKTKRKVKKASQKMLHGKDKALHPEQVKQEEEEKKDKSQSAELERKHLQRLKEEEMAREVHLRDRLKNDLHLRTREESRQDKSRSIPGNGPEDGIPAPEGKR